MSADFTPEKEDIKILPPFKMQVLTNFPYIEADFDALTNYQLLCKVVEYLNMVIHNENEVTEEVTGLYNAYVALQNYVNNYFDNLDVQEEINKKLDVMATDGTLENLLQPYFNTIIQPQIDEIVDDITDFKNDINSNVATQNVKINNIENLVDNAVSGSPLVATSTSEMTDTTRVYVNTTDGNWYYYDGDSWEIGGTYQATGISDATQIPFKNIQYKNSLYDLTDVIDWSSFSGNSSRTINLDGSLTVAIISDNVGGVQFEIPRGKNYLIEIKCKNDTNVKNGWYLQNWSTNNLNLRIGDGLNFGYLDLRDVPDVSNTIALYSYNAYSITIEYIKLYEISNINKLEIARNNLEYFINNYENLINYNNIIEKPEKINLSLINEWHGTGSITSFYKNESEVHITGSGEVGFSYDKIFNNTNDILKIKYTASVDGVRAYITSTIGGIIYSSAPSIADEEMNLSIDLNNLTIYNNLPEQFKILIAYPEQGSSQTIIISNIYIYKNNIEDNIMYNNKLSIMLNNIMNSINNNTSDIMKYNNLSKNYLISPNGTKYKLNVDNNGHLSASTYNPTKALYIGNSLLRGFGTHGMASSTVNTDYYALVNSYLHDIDNNYTASKVPDSDIETATSEESGESWADTTVSTYMTNDTDLVIIQLGDNTANDQDAIDVFVHNMNYLINALKEVNPNVEILLVGVWYNANIMMPLLNQIATENPSITLVDISDLNTPANQSYIGASYIDADGNPQTIDSIGVASHPSDTGFTKIAERIIYNI